VGTALRKDSRMGREKAVCAWAMKDLRSVLEMPPMGLMSAEEQSYFVR
jgi:hypothetical protein